jgi:hypothetical protein
MENSERNAWLLPLTFKEFSHALGQKRTVEFALCDL